MAKIDKQIRFYRKHGPLYGIWANMKTRCNNPNFRGYKYYGGRGISIDPTWNIFNNFKRDMNGGYREGLTLDRIDSNKNYSLENCRWETMKTQQNNRRNNHFFEFMGIADTLTNWANYFGIKRSALAQRIYVYKWSMEKSLSKEGISFG